MEATKIDDMLIEMIEPKMVEIKKKFTEGGTLTQEDINTLLLKSQYNHINHLDEKLNETTDNVASLKGEFNNLKGEFNELKSDMNNFKLELKSDMNNFKLEIRSDMNNLKGEFKLLEQKIETSIQKALNKNVIIIITALGLFTTVSKLIDKLL